MTVSSLLLLPVLLILQFSFGIWKSGVLSFLRLMFPMK